MMRVVLVMFVAVAGCQEPHYTQQQQASVIDFGNMLASCHAGDPLQRLKRREYWDYGCFCGSGGAGKAVDKTDEICEAHDACWKKVKQDYGVSCYGENYHFNTNDPATGQPTNDCSKWTFAESCSKAKHPTNNKPEEEACCKCDLEAIKGFQAARATYAQGYRDWSDGDDPGATCGPNKGKQYKCKSGYIKRGEPCQHGTKRGDRFRGYWCETTCTKPETCETSTAAGNAYAKCVAPGAGGEEGVSCATATAAIVYATADADVRVIEETACTGQECEECPFCTDDTCTGNHAVEEASSDEWYVDEEDDGDWSGEDPLDDDDDAGLPLQPNISEADAIAIP